MSYKVIIELDFDTYKPKPKDIIEYVNELGKDIGYVLIDNSKDNRSLLENKYWYKQPTNRKKEKNRKD